VLYRHKYSTFYVTDLDPQNQVCRYIIHARIKGADPLSFRFLISNIFHARAKCLKNRLIFRFSRKTPTQRLFSFKFLLKYEKIMPNIILVILYIIKYYSKNLSLRFLRKTTTTDYAIRVYFSFF